VLGWRKVKSSGETLLEIVLLRQYALASTGLLAGDYTLLDPNITDNDMELKRTGEDKTMHRLATVHDFLEMWQGR
jgi:hypothetical protein